MDILEILFAFVATCLTACTIFLFVLFIFLIVAIIRDEVKYHGKK